MFDRIAKWYAMGLWTTAMVLQAVEKGVITPQEANQILEVTGDG